MDDQDIINFLNETNDVAILPEIKESDLFAEFNGKLTKNNSFEVIKEYNIKKLKYKYETIKICIENINTNLKYLGEIKQKYNNIIESLQLSFNCTIISKNENTTMKNYILELFNDIDSKNITFYMFEFLKTDITNNILDNTNSSISSTLHHFKILFSNLEEEILRGKSIIKEYKKEQYKIINTIKFYNKITDKIIKKPIKKENTIVDIIKIETNIQSINDDDNNSKKDITKVSNEKKTKETKEIKETKETKNTKLNNNSKRKKENQISLNVNKKIKK